MKKLISYSILFSIVLLLVTITSRAQEKTSFFPVSSEVVFLLDTSDSMKSDTDGSVQDTVMPDWG